MTRKIVSVVKSDNGGRKPDYNDGFDDAVYWDDDNVIADDLTKGEVSIIPHE